MLTLAQLHDELHRLIQRGLDARLDAGEISDALQAELDELEVTAPEAVRSDIIFGNPSCEAPTDLCPGEQPNNDGGNQPAAPSGDLGRTMDTGGQRSRFANVMHQSRVGGMPEPDAADLEAFAACLDRDTSRPWPSGPCWERLRACGFYTTENDGLTGDKHVPTEKGLAAVADLRRGAA